MEKDFDQWNKLKKDLHKRHADTFAYPREIWWCSLGVNVGAEMDGKNDRFHHKIVTEQKTVWVKITQARVISNKRLLRKVDILGEEEFNVLKSILKESL